MIQVMKLILGNSYSQVTGLNTEQFQALKYIISYTVDAGTAYHSRGRSPKRYLIDKKGNLPSGLTRYVREFLDSTQVDYTVVDGRVRPKAATPLTLSGFTPYLEQTEAVEALVKAERGVCQAVTGFGKSFTIALLVARLNLKTLIVVPNLELKAQLTATFRKLFGGGPSNVTIENIDSSALNRLTAYDVLILDESHHGAAKTYRTLNHKSWGSIYYRFCFTATSFRSREEEQLLMEALTGQVVYNVDYPTAVTKNYIVPIEAYYYDVPSPPMKGNPTSWPAVYSELIVNNCPRNRLICRLLDSLAGIPTLCLVKEILHGASLSQLTQVPFANGKDGMARQRILEFCLGETRGLIGTTGVLGEGIDSRPAEWILLAAGGKSKTQFIQQVGRGVRTYLGKTSCKVVMFRDASNPFLLKHFKACVKYLKDEYAVIPVKLDFPTDLL